MYSTVPSPINRTQTVAPICKLFAKTFRSQGSPKMYRRKAGSVGSCDSLATSSSASIQGKIPCYESSPTKTRAGQKTGNIDKELEVLARELLPRVLRMPFSVEQWMSAIYSVCDQYATDSSGDDFSDKGCNQRKRLNYPERPKLPTIGLASMEKRLRDPQAKLCPSETQSPSPQQTISLRVPDPMSIPIMWVPKLPPQTAQLLKSMPCEIFQDIHRDCKQDNDKPPAKKCPPRRKSPQRKPLSRPVPKPKPKPRQKSRRRRRRPCCCCCRMTRQELACAGMGAGMGAAYTPPSKPASAPPSATPKFKSKPAPKPKPKAKPAPKKAAKADKAADEEAPPKIEVKAEEAKPAPAAKAGSDSSSDDSSEDDTPPATPAAPAAPAAPPAGGKDFMSDLFASSPAPSGAASPKPAADDWMSSFGGTSSPKPPASSGADWLTGGASSPQPPASTGADWLTGAAPKATSPGSDWLS